MSKKFYWLKLKDDFFGQKEIKKLRKIAGGDTYTIIYLKLQLLSLKNEGKLIYEGIEDNLIEELSLDMDEEVENVKMTFMFLEKHNLLEMINTDEYFLPKAIESMGKESDSAERVRKHRELKKEKEKDLKKELEKHLHLEIEGNATVTLQALQCNNQKPPEAVIQHDPYVLFFENNFREPIAPVFYTRIKEFETKGIEQKLIILAMEKAIGTDKPTEYIKGTLQKLLDAGVKTVDEYEKARIAFEKKKTQKQQHKTPQVANFEQRQYADEDFDVFYQNK